MGCASSLSSTPAPPQGKRSQHPREGHTTHVTSYSVEHGHTTYCSSGTELTRRSHSPDHDLIFHIDTLSMLSQTSSLTLRSQKTMIKACQPSGNFQSQFNYGVENEVVHDNAANKSQHQGVASSNFEDHVGSTNGFLLPATRNSIRMGHEAATSTHAHTQAPSSSLSSGGLIMQQHRMPYFMASISQSGPAATFTATAPPVKTCTVVFPPSGSSLVGAPSLRFKVTSGGLKEEGEYLREVSTNNHSHNHTNRFSIGASETASGHLGHVHNRHSFNTVHSPISRSPWENAAFTTTCHCADESHRSFSSPSSVQMAFTTSCNNRQRDNTANGLNNRVSSTHSIYSPVVSCPSRRRGATHANNVSTHMGNEKDFPSSHTMGMEEWPQGVVAGCECHRRYMVAGDHNAADSSNRHNRDKGVGTEEGYLSEADKDTVRRINSRRRKQVTLSSDPWSLEHYRRGTFFIPDNDSYYDASGVELIVNRCEYVVVPPSARPSPLSPGFQCEIGANAAEASEDPLQEPLVSDSIPAMCDCCSTEEGAPNRCPASVSGVAVVGGRHALPKPIELSPLVGPQDGNRPRDLMQMTSAIFDLSGRSGGGTRGSHGDLSLENMSCFLLERSQNSGNTQGAGNAGQNSVPATIRHDAVHTRRGELPDAMHAMLYDSLTPPYPTDNTIRMSSPLVRVLKSSLKQHHQMHAVQANMVHSPCHNHVGTSTTHEVIGGAAHPLLQPESDHNASVFSLRATASEHAVEHCPPKPQPTDGRQNGEEAIGAEGTTTNAEAERVPDKLSLAQIEGCSCGLRKELLEMGEAEKQPSPTDTDDETRHHAKNVLHLESISGGDTTALSSTRNVENDKGGAMMLSFLNVNCNNNSSSAQPDSTGSPLSPTTFRPKPSPSRFAGKLSARLSLSVSISKESFGVGGSGQVGPLAKGQHADEDKKHEYNEENQDEKFAKSAQGCCPILGVTSDYLTKNTITSTTTASDPQEFEIIREVVRNDAAAENVLVASMTTTSSVDFTAATNAVHSNSLNTTMRTETYQSNFSPFTTPAAAAPAAAATATTVKGIMTKEMLPIDDEVPARGTPLGSASPSVRRKLTAARSANNLLSTHLTLSPRAGGAIIKRSDFPTPTARALTQASAANTGSSPRVKPHAAPTSVVLTLRRSASCGAALCEKMDSKDAYSSDEDSSFSTGFFPNDNSATGNGVVGYQTSRRQEGFGSLTSFDGTVMKGVLQKECFSKDNCACGALVANQDLRVGRRGLSKLKWDSSSSREGGSSVHFHQGDTEGEADNLSPTATIKGIVGVVGNGEPPNFFLSPSLLAATEKEMVMENEGAMDTTHQLHFRRYYNNTNSEQDIRAMTDCEEGRDMCDNLNANSSANVENGAHSLEQLLECPELKSQSLSSTGVTLVLGHNNNESALLSTDDKASRPSEGTAQALASALAAPSKKGKETRPIVANLIIDANDEDKMAAPSQARRDIFIINNDCNTNNNNNNDNMVNYYDTNNSSTTDNALSSRCCSFASVPQSPLSSTKMSFRRRALLERGVVGALSPPDNVNSSGGEKTNEEIQSPLRFLRNEAPDSRPVGERMLLPDSSTFNTTHKSCDDDEGVPATSMVIKAGSESSSFEGGRKRVRRAVCMK